MKLFICTDHEGYWPVGTASVIVAENVEQAKALLDEKLSAKGLGTGYTLEEIDIDKPAAYVLRDGNY